MNRSLYCVILAGGTGERLWPLSRTQKPKQLLSLGKKNLLEHTLDRAYLLTDQSHIWVVATKKQELILQEYCNNRIATLLLEPEGRNTGPAIITACLQLYKQDPEAVVFFMPSDAFIPESSYEVFKNALEQAITLASEQKVIALIGLRPTYPATGYGYITYENQGKINRILAFHEKPTALIAQEYLKKTNMLWNIGIFCSRVDLFLEECKTYAAPLYNDVYAYSQGKKEYNHISSISIDYAVMEKSKNLVVVPAKFLWSDVGNVYTFSHLKQQVNNNNHYIAIDAQNNIVDVPDKLVALIGIHDVCVIETNDALLIVKQDEAEKVRAVVEQLKQSGKMEYL